jgi:hypothetical protein
MKVNSTAVLVGILVLAGGIWLTRPPVERVRPAGLSPEPWDHPIADHITDHGLRIGQDAGSDIMVSHEGDKVRVELSAKYLSSGTETLLAKLGMASKVEIMSWQRYTEFLDTVHLTLQDHDHTGTDEGGGHEGGEESHPEDIPAASSSASLTSSP